MPAGLGAAALDPCPPLPPPPSGLCSPTKVSPSVTIKEECVLLNIGGVRAVVTGDKCLLFEPGSPSSRKFLEIVMPKIQAAGGRFWGLASFSFWMFLLVCTVLEAVMPRIQAAGVWALLQRSEGWSAGLAGRCTAGELGCCMQRCWQTLRGVCARHAALNPHPVVSPPCAVAASQRRAMMKGLRLAGAGGAAAAAAAGAGAESGDEGDFYGGGAS